MNAFISLLVALCAVVQALHVTFDVPEVITNEQRLPIRLAIGGGDIGSSEVTKARTVLYTPGKRSPKFYGNLTHSEIEHLGGSNFEIVPAYSLPVQNYKIGFSLLVSSEGEQQWIDSELIDTKIVDPQLSSVQLLGALTLVATAIIGFVQLCFRLAAPGFWESTLPAWTHKFLPQQPKKKRN